MSETLTMLTGAVVSVIVAYLTSKLTYRNEIGKNLYEKRQKVYLDLFQTLDKLQKDRYLIFRYKFITELNELKPSIYLFGSHSLKDGFEKLYQLIDYTYNKYMELFEDVEALNRESGMLQEQKDYGYSREEAEVRVAEIIMREKENYMDSHCISEVDLLRYITNIVSEMRNDLKINK